MAELMDFCRDNFIPPEVRQKKLESLVEEEEPPLLTVQGRPKTACGAGMVIGKIDPNTGRITGEVVGSTGQLNLKIDSNGKIEEGLLKPGIDFSE